jgi:hypothetical protein
MKRILTFLEEKLRGLEAFAAKKKGLGSAFKVDLTNKNNMIEIFLGFIKA